MTETPPPPGRRPVLSLVRGGWDEEPLVLAGITWSTEPGVEIVRELLERGRQRGDQRSSALIAASGVLALRASRALLENDPDGPALARLAIALRDQAIADEVRAAWDAENEPDV